MLEPLLLLIGKEGEIMPEILFTETSTFYPDAYDDLDINKRINYIAIGGGGAGASVRNGNTASFVGTSGGTSGGTTSIGSYVSCPGGATANTGVGNDSDYKSARGGNGGDGYIIHAPLTGLGNATQGYRSDSNTNTINGRITVVDANDYYVVYSDISNYSTGIAAKPRASASNSGDLNLLQSAQSSYMSSTHGTSGSGYGAGGGGGASSGSWAAAGHGGFAGTIKMGSFALNSMDAIKITIGSGGTAHTNNSVSSKGHPGKSGAVLLWW